MCVIDIEIGQISIILHIYASRLHLATRGNAQLGLKW